jgi:hypothetical protein
MQRPGPWYYDGYAHVSKTRGRTDMVASAHDPDDGSHCTKRSEANAQLIAHAPGDIAALLAEVARLREALKPFATISGYFNEALPDETPLGQIPRIHVALGYINRGDLRRARAALQAVEETP